MPDSPSLLGVKLRSYVRTLFQVELDSSDSSTRNTGVESSVAGHVHEGRGVVVTQGRRGLGPALWWGSIAGVTSLDVIVDVDDDDTGGHLCRRSTPHRCPFCPPATGLLLHR